MPTEITMPQLGESVTEGTVGRWLKQPGDRVERYEPLLEVTNDKVDTEVPAPFAGVLQQILIPEGETVRVGTPIALMEAAEQADVPAPAQAASAPAAVPPSAPASASARPSASAPARPASVPAPSNGQSNRFISPVVARLAEEHQLDLSLIKGTGLGGRISKRDVLNYILRRAAETAEAAPSAVPAQPPVAAPAAPSVPPATEPPIELPPDSELLPISAMRRAIAEHMTRSRRTIPHVTTVAEVDLGGVVAHRERTAPEFERQNVRLTYTAYFVQAVAAALRAVPIINASYTDQGIQLHHRVNISVAVALDDGLIVPVVRDADEKNLLGLARAIGDLTERARTKRLSPDDVQGGTFTITNHGVNGSIFAMPIINHPQAAILGVGAIQKRVVVLTNNGQDSIAIRPMCYMSLSFDHRLIDGATADLFMMEIKRQLEAM